MSVNPDFKDHFSGFTSAYDQKIQRGKELRPSEKLRLGRAIEKFERERHQAIFKETLNLAPDASEGTIAETKADAYVREYTVLFNGSRRGSIRALLGSATEETEKVKELLDGLENMSEESQDKFRTLISLLLLNVDTSTHPQADMVNAKFKELLGTASAEEISKTKTDSSKMERLATLLELNILPDVPETPVVIGRREYSPSSLQRKYIEINDQKNALVLQCVPPDIASQIATQAAKFPLMQAAVAALKENLGQWEASVFDRDRMGVKLIKEKVEQQLKNLVVLSRIIGKVSKGEDNEKALSMISPLDVLPNPTHRDDPVNASFRLATEMYVDGEADMTNPSAQEVWKQVLSTSIDDVKNERPEVKTPEELKQARKDAPVTRRAIQLQAELHQVIRSGKAWAAQQDRLRGQNQMSANIVYQLKDVDDASKTVAFFKIGDEDEEAAGAMERLMWDIAVVMGLEEMFVPTGETQVRAKGQPGAGTQTVVQWDGSGNLEKLTTAQPSLRGGIQVAQKGELLSSKMANEAPIRRDEIVNSVVTSLVFGMFDAHAGNIFVTDKGQIKFFDNTRSLPNSNGFIRRGENIISAYRSSLLDLPDSSQKLTKNELDEIKHRVNENKAKMENLKTFLHSPQGQAQLGKLPPGWMDLEASFAAMEQRIDNMLEALENNTVSTLHELTAAANPAYKFAYALTCLTVLRQEEGKMPDKEMHARVNLFYIAQMIDHLSAIGFDLGLVKTWCDDPAIGMNRLTDKMVDLYADTVKRPVSKKVLKGREEMAQRLKDEITHGAAIDFKDWDQYSCEMFMRKKNLEKLDTMGFNYEICDQANDPEALQEYLLDAIKPKTIPFIMKDRYRDLVIFESPNGFRVKEVNLRQAAGKVIMDGQEIETADLPDHLTALAQHPTYDDLPGITADFAKKQVNRFDSRIVLRKCENGEDLGVTIRLPSKIFRKGKALEHVFKPTQDGKFRVDAEHLLSISGAHTIEDILDAVQKDLLQKK